MEENFGGAFHVHPKEIELLSVVKALSATIPED
jgi:hypothetical protein